MAMPAMSPLGMLAHAISSLILLLFPVAVKCVVGPEKVSLSSLVC